VGLLALGFVLGSWPIVAVVSLVLLTGTAVPRLAAFQAVYRRVLRPRGLVRPDVRDDDPAPHRFAQGVGGAVTLAAALLLAGGYTVLGWTLAGVVVALAGLNLATGICVGCLLYLQLHRAGLRAPAWPGEWD
ncbi:MAG TPA: DUF4395 domain-containing protein, partial [Gemmatimonadales bacterium]|nr:DUF4395 domain-containing protein [Gemmatimonadales bacterium]